MLTKKAVNVGFDYGADWTVQDFLDAINNLKFEYDSGIDVSTPFTDGKASDDDDSYDTGSGYVKDGRIYYTAYLSAKLDANGHIVITSDVYNLDNTSIEVTETGSGNWTQLTGINAF